MIKKKTMDNNELFRAVVSSQSAMKSELLGEISKLRKETEKGFEGVNKKMDKGFKDVNNRCDLIGKQLNALDEDAPTGEDFNNLVKRVDKLEKYKNFATA